MDNFGFGGERSRQRFIEKASKAGFHESMARWRPDLVHYSLNTLALVWPEETYFFNQIIVRGRQIKDVAVEQDVDVRMIHRRLAGYEGKTGAEDWFLITLQLYREADFVYPNGADVVHGCFLPGDWADSAINPCLRVFFLALVEAAAGNDVRTVLDSVPWRSAGADKTLAWPCYTDRPPLEGSQLPGVLAVLQSADNIKDRLQMALLTSFFSTNEPSVWQELLAILNTGDCRTVAAHGRIPQEYLAQAEASACLLLSNRSLLGPRAVAVQYGLMGMLTWTPLSWDKLCTYMNDARLRNLTTVERLHYCSKLYLGAQF